MSSLDPDPMDPLLERLIESERLGEDVPPDLDRQMFESVLAGAAMGPASPAQPAPPTTSSAPTATLARTGRVRALLHVGTFVAGGLVGSVVTARVLPTHTRVVVREVLREVPVAVQPRSTPADAGAAPMASPMAPVALPRVTAPSSTRPPESVVRVRAPGPPDAGPRFDLQAEEQLLDAARAALQGGNYRESWAAIQEHERRFPHGQLAERREALGVRVLVALGRTEEARRRADAFRARYPDSPFLPMVSIEGSP